MSYYPYPQNPNQYRPERNGLSTASLVLGILSLLGLCIIILIPLAGVITGHLAYKREPASRPLSVTGLVTSWIGLALSVVLYVFVALALFWSFEFFDSMSGYETTTYA